MSRKEKLLNVEPFNINVAILNNLKVEHNHDFNFNPRNYLELHKGMSSATSDHRSSGSEASKIESNAVLSPKPYYGLNLDPSLISSFSGYRIEPAARLEDYSVCSVDEEDSVETVPVNKRSKSQGLPNYEFLEEPEKRVVDRQTQSCRWPGESLLDISAMHILGYYPSEGSQTIEIETPCARTRPMAYNYSDQLDSTRQQDQRTRAFLLGFDKEDRGGTASILTPASSLLSPMSSAGANSSAHNFKFTGPPSTSHDSPVWYPGLRGRKTGPPKKRLSIERVASSNSACGSSVPIQPTLDDMPRFKKTGLLGANVVPETASFEGLQGGYFIGTWELPNKMQVIIDKNGEIRSVDRQISLLTRFISARQMEIIHPDKSVEIATLSSDGAKIELERTGVWTAVNDVEVEVISTGTIDHQLRELDIIKENRETARMLPGSMIFKDLAVSVHKNFKAVHSDEDVFDRAEQGDSARGKNNSPLSHCLSGCDLM